jgi:hypothetical protein
MSRFSLKELKLAIDAGCSQLDDTEMVVVGSMSLLGHAKGELPPQIQVTMDIDLYPKNKDDDSLAKTKMALDYGEASKFREEHGWYIEVLGGWTTDRTPPGWMDRTNQVVTDKGNVGHCLSPLDLAYNKATVARGKDYNQVQSMIDIGYISYGDLKKIIADFPPAKGEHRENAEAFVAKIGKTLRSSLPEISRVPKQASYLCPSGAGKTGHVAK